MHPPIPTALWQLSAKRHARYHAEFDANRKHLSKAYTLLLCAGLYGAHKFYLGRRRAGVIYFVAGLVATLFVLGLGLIFLIGQSHPLLYSLTLVAVVATYMWATGAIGGFALCVGGTLLLDAVTLPDQVAESNLAIQEALVKSLCAEEKRSSGQHHG